MAVSGLSADSSAEALAKGEGPTAGGTVRRGGFQFPVELSKSKSGSKFKPRNKMALGHEKPDVYRLSISYVAWVYEMAENLNGIHRHARDQWLRASQSIPLNIAEGNGKTAEADRRRYFEIARGSTLECAAIQDVLKVGNALAPEESSKRKMELDRMAVILSRLAGRGYCMKEDVEVYGCTRIDPNFDFDFDPDERKFHVGDSNSVPPLPSG